MFAELKAKKDRKLKKAQPAVAGAEHAADDHENEVVKKLEVTLVEIGLRFLKF